MRDPTAPLPTMHHAANTSLLHPCWHCMCSFLLRRGVLQRGSCKGGCCEGERCREAGARGGAVEGVLQRGWCKGECCGGEFRREAGARGAAQGKV
eukprot:1045132-Pelagomonas_calceolata.AAC.3